MVAKDPADPKSLKIPVINTETCIGCGACEYLCPSRPYSAIYVEGHEMHTEYFSVNLATIKKLIDHDGCAVAVGTTSVRTLESLYHIGVTLAENPDATEEELLLS